MWGLLVLAVQGVLGLQEFLETPAYSEVNPGASVVLQCFVSGKGGECRWEKDGNPVGIFADKYEWAGPVEEGNCSLAILDASSEYDDGVWQCQVTASNFKEGDSLISEGAEVVVRAAPRSLNLEGKAEGTVGEQLGLECVSRGGNPAPALTFSLDGLPVTAGTGQRNSRLLDGGWESRLSLPLTLTREQQGGRLVCTAQHPVLVAPLTTATTLDVSFPPAVAVVTTNASTVQEGSAVLLSCSASARPEPTLLWEREGVLMGHGAVLLLPAVTKEEAGRYLCRGENRLGRGEPGSASLEVLYAPAEVEVAEARLDLELGAEGAVLGCGADGVPAPTFRWLRGAERREVGRGARLRLGPAAYSHGGAYYCEAANTLGQAESHAVSVEVRGAPRVQEEGGVLVVGAGEALAINVRFCANPLPVLAWHSAEGGLLRPLAEDGRRAVVVEQEEDGHCYSARLEVERAQGGDAGKYLLQLENEHGSASHLVTVKVLETAFTREIIIAIVAGGLLTLAILAFVLATRCRCKAAGSETESKTDVESCGTSTSSSQNTRNEKMDCNSLEDLVFNDSYESYRQPDIIPASSKRTPSPAVLAAPSYNELCFPKSSNGGSMRKARPPVRPKPAYLAAPGGVYTGPLTPTGGVYTGPQVFEHSINQSLDRIEHINTMSYSNYVGQDSLYHWRKSVDNEMYA